MVDFIQKLKNSEPTLSDDAALELYRTFTIDAYNMGWVLHSSAIAGFDDTVKLAELYTDALSVLDTTRERLSTSVPGYVLQAVQETFSLWGLLYSNGAVVYLESNNPENPPLLFVWIERDLLDKLGVVYVDTAKEGVWNVPERWLTGGDIPE